ncbi:MAG: hypothetical protein PVG29_06485, partial [Gammaproteobacteria bacterium]
MEDAVFLPAVFFPEGDLPAVFFRTGFFPAAFFDALFFDGVFFLGAGVFAAAAFFLDGAFFFEGAFAGRAFPFSTTPDVQVFRACLANLTTSAMSSSEN